MLTDFFLFGGNAMQVCFVGVKGSQVDDVMGELTNDGRVLLSSSPSSSLPALSGDWRDCEDGADDDE